MPKSSARRASPKQTPASLRTLAELAKLVERDEGTVSRWLKRADWPFQKRAPFPRAIVPKILRWVADTLIVRESTAAVDDDDPDGMQGLKKQKLRKEIAKLHAQADLAQTDIAKIRGELLDASAVEREWASIGVLMRNAFQSLGSQLVPLALSQGLPHQAAPAFQKQIEETVASILRQLSRDGSPDRAERDEDDDSGAAEVLPKPFPAGAVDAVGVG